MKYYKVVVTFASMNEILWCYHSNKSSSLIFSRATIRLAAFCKMRVAILPSFDFNRSPGFHVTDRWPAGSIFNR